MSIDNKSEVLEDVLAGDNKDKLNPSYNPYTVINCALNVGLDTENVAVYVCKPSTQCFNFTALKCCGKGDIKIEAIDQGWYNNELNVLNFGKFTLRNGGICFKPDEDIMANDSKTLNFKASACGDSTLFSVTFVYDPCKCCCPGRNCANR